MGQICSLFYFSLFIFFTVTSCMSFSGSLIHSVSCKITCVFLHTLFSTYGKFFCVLQPYASYEFVYRYQNFLTTLVICLKKCMDVQKYKRNMKGKFGQTFCIWKRESKLFKAIAFFSESIIYKYYLLWIFYEFFFYYCCFLSWL